MNYWPIFQEFGLEITKLGFTFSGVPIKSDSPSSKVQKHEAPNKKPSLSLVNKMRNT